MESPLFAFVIVLLNDPGPLSLAFVTVKVAAVAGPAIASIVAKVDIRLL